MTNQINAFMTDFDGSANGGAEKAVGVTSVATSSGAVVACSACCVLPLALPAVTLGAAGGVLAWLTAAHIWITIIAAIAVLGGWLWVWLQSIRYRARAATTTIVMLSISTGMLVLALSWPALEPSIVRLLQG